MKPETKQLLNERLQLFDDTVHFKKARRTPTYGSIYSWRYLDSDMGLSIEESLQDFDIMEKILREMHERYNFDVYQNVAAYYDVKKQYIIGKDKCNMTITGNEIVSVDRNVIVDDDILAYCKNPVMYVWTKSLPALFKDEPFTFGMAKQLIEKTNAVNAHTDKMYDILINEYGVPNLQSMPAGISAYLHPLEVLGTLRGIKNYSIDLRRRKDAVKEYININAEAFFATAKNMLDNGKQDTALFDLFIAFLMHHVMSVGQFEEFYWPEIKKLIDYMMEKQRTSFIMWESDCIRFADFFKDIPKGVLCIQPEVEDIKDVRRAFPNAALCGGMNVDMLGRATPQVCVDRAKDLIDTIGEGLILSQNKFLCFAYDAKRENLLATQEFVLNYKH